MKVTVDTSSGFCWGVIRTVNIAEQELASGEPLYSLGDIIHNPVEIERLREKGLATIAKSDFEKLRGAKVLIRAHGEPPETFKRAQELGITLIDATCPVVTKVQERIRKFYNDGYQVVIFGKREHAEVIGLVGQTNGEALVVKSLDELECVQLNRKTVLFSQTTMDKPTFHAMKIELSKRVQDLVIGSMEETAIEFHAKDTICGQVSGREKKIREFSAAHDVVLFVAGKHSSNGKVLFDIVQSTNPRVHFIEQVQELREDWFEGIETVGITGATSTPQWLMEQVKQEIEKMNKETKNVTQPKVVHEFITH
jgi:4-hydroxy-3-methylbut-2-en-1-yl diphosphate reductase